MGVEIKSGHLKEIEMVFKYMKNYSYTHNNTKKMQSMIIFFILFF